jgi:hypothetical protein
MKLYNTGSGRIEVHSATAGVELSERDRHRDQVQRHRSE